MNHRHTIRHIRIDPTDGRIAQEDYLAIAAWWPAHGADMPPPRLILPTCGAIATDSTEKPIACSFLYLDATGSGAAWLAWTATAPHTPPRLAYHALTSLITFLTDHARSLNYWVIGATFAPRGLIRLCQSVGFSSGDTQLTHLYKPL